MKKTTLLALSLLVLFACGKDKNCNDPISINFNTSNDCEYVDTEQNGIIMKFTGTWCAPCGAWGATQMKRELDRKPNLIGLEVHLRDVMTTYLSTQLDDYFNIKAVPTFKFNGGVRNIRLDKDPDVGLHLVYKIKNGELTTTTTIKGLLPGKTQDYQLAVYLIEDGKVERQLASDHSAHPEWEYERGAYPKYIHDNILRDEVNESFFGKDLEQDMIAEDEIITRTDIMTLREEYDGDLYAVAALWVNNGGTYSLVNAVSGKK